MCVCFFFCLFVTKVKPWSHNAQDVATDLDPWPNMITLTTRVSNQINSSTHHLSCYSEAGYEKERYHQDQIQLQISWER